MRPAKQKQGQEKLSKLDRDLTKMVIVDNSAQNSNDHRILMELAERSEPRVTFTSYPACNSDV